MRKLLILGLVLASSAASAQPGQPPPDPDAGAPMPPPNDMPPPMPAQPGMAAPAPAPVAEPSNVPKGVIEDANAGRSWIAPTALTEPKGTFTFSDFELLLISDTYAVTDQISVGVTTILPIVQEMPKTGAVNIKAQFLNQGRLHIAGQAALMGGLFSSTNSMVDAMGNLTETTQSDGLGFLMLGGAATYCLDDDCYSHVTGYLAAGFVREQQSAVPFLASVNAAVRVGRHLKLIAEIDTGFIAGEVDAAADGALVWYGVRFTSREIGVDLGFLKPVAFDGTTVTDLLMGVPFVSFSYRAI
ncbi:MAG: hypothetical protein NT062_01025 [Proteobacteria bacterium]|nr:hypothetical protein [Pseudomonadota bacterium]